MPDGAPADTVTQLRRDLAAAYRLIAHFGMDDGLYTHISARLPDGPGGEKRFLLNPYGLRFDEVTAANLVTVDETGAVVDDPYGAGVNAAGFTIHSAVHMARHDAVHAAVADKNHVDSLRYHRRLVGRFVRRRLLCRGRIEVLVRRYVRRAHPRGAPRRCG